MLVEGCVHVLASDTHDLTRRPPDLAEGRRAAERLIGGQEAGDLVVTRPQGVLENKPPGELPAPRGAAKTGNVGGENENAPTSRDRSGGGMARRLQRLFAG